MSFASLDHVTHIYGARMTQYSIEPIGVNQRLHQATSLRLPKHGRMKVLFNLCKITQDMPL